MITLAVETAREARFRHVMFKGQCAAVPLNLAPPQPAPPPPPPVQHPALSWAAGEALELDDVIFLHWLFERAGMALCEYRPETIRRRLPACLRALRVNSPAGARERLENDPGLVAHAISTMVIGVTGFLRDKNVFDQLRDTVLPALPRRAGHPRVWSIGCSDGQELYSVAMLLGEMNLLRGGATLLGTDCRSAAVARARQGQYDDAAVRDVPPNFLDKYFLHHNTTWRVCDELRCAIQWRTADITRLAEPGAWDLILCRNVCMYFRCETAHRLRLICEQALRPGGFLVFGKAERPTGSTRLASIGPCIYRKE